VVAIVVESDLADRHDPWCLRQCRDAGERRLVGGAGIMGMDSHRAVDVGLRRRQGHGRLRGRDVRPDRQEAAHAGGPRPIDHRDPIAVEGRVVQMGMGVDEHAHPSTRKRRRPIS
jgi:hypothetical protein